MTATEAKIIGDIPELRERLAALQSEASGIDAAIERAAGAGDEGEVMRLLVRQRIIPHQLTNARAALLRAQIAEVEAESAIYKTAEAEALVAAQSARAALVAANEALREADAANGLAQGQLWNAGENHRQLTQRIVGLREELGRLIDPPAPTPIFRPQAVIAEGGMRRVALVAAPAGQPLPA